MYLVPYLFIDNKDIKFPKDYEPKFSLFKNGDDILIAYGEMMILFQQWESLFNKINAEKIDKKTKLEIKKINAIKEQLYHKCFVTPHKSIMFHSQEMTNQFNYIYFLVLKNYHTLETFK